MSFEKLPRKRKSNHKHSSRAAVWTQPEAAALNVHGLTGVAHADGQQTANVQPETSKAVISRGRQLFPGTASQALLPSPPHRNGIDIISFASHYHVGAAMCSRCYLGDGDPGWESSLPSPSSRFTSTTTCTCDTHGGHACPCYCAPGSVPQAASVVGESVWPGCKQPVQDWAHQQCNWTQCCRVTCMTRDMHAILHTCHMVWPRGPPFHCVSGEWTHVAVRRVMR